MKNPPCPDVMFLSGSSRRRHESASCPPFESFVLLAVALQVFSSSVTPNGERPPAVSRFMIPVWLGVGRGIYKERSVMCSDTLAISRASGSETAKESWCLSAEEDTFSDALLLFSLRRLISASGSERRGREKSVFGVLCPRKSVSG